MILTNGMSMAQLSTMTKEVVALGIDCKASSSMSTSVGRTRINHEDIKRNTYQEGLYQDPLNDETMVPSYLDTVENHMQPHTHLK